MKSKFLTKLKDWNEIKCDFHAFLFGAETHDFAK